MLLFVLLIQATDLFSQSPQPIIVDAPPSVEVNSTRVSLSFGNGSAGSTVTWSIPDAQIVYQSPDQSTIEVIFNTTGSKTIQAWGYANNTGSTYGIAYVEVMGVQPVYVTGQVGRWRFGRCLG